MLFQWLFVVETKQNAGLGHFFRCLSIAIELNRQNVSQVSFYLTETNNFFRKELEEHGICLINNTENKMYDGMVFDGYDFSDPFFESLRSKTNFRAAIVDNIKSIKNMDIKKRRFNLEICPVSVEEKFKFAIVRPEFSYEDSLNCGDASSVMINFGGCDSHNMTLKILKALKKSSFIEKLEVVVVLTRNNMHQQQVKEFLTNSNLTYKLLIDTDKMSAEMRDCGLIIGSGGIGLLERISLRKPSITIMTAENQYIQTKIAVESGATLDGGDAQSFDSRIFITNFERLYLDSFLQEKIIEQCKVTFDSAGSKRVATLLSSAMRETYAVIENS